MGFLYHILFVVPLILAFYFSQSGARAARAFLRDYAMKHPEARRRKSALLSQSFFDSPRMQKRFQMLHQQASREQSNQQDEDAKKAEDGGNTDVIDDAVFEEPTRTRIGGVSSNTPVQTSVNADVHRWVASSDRKHSVSSRKQSAHSQKPASINRNQSGSSMKPSERSRVISESTNPSLYSNASYNYTTPHSSDTMSPSSSETRKSTEGFRSAASSEDGNGSLPGSAVSEIDLVAMPFVR